MTPHGRLHANGGLDTALDSGAVSLTTGRPSKCKDLRAMQKGYIYVLTNTVHTGNVKIGKTTKDPIQRAAELSSASGVIGRFEVYSFEECGDIDHAEALTHQALKKYRTQSNREFFAIPADMATKIIIKCVSLIEDIDNVENFGSGIILKSQPLPDKSLEPELKTYSAFFICPRCGTGFTQSLVFGEDDVRCPNCEGL
jgi:hypothetical protein